MGPDGKARWLDRASGTAISVDLDGSQTGVAGDPIVHSIYDRPQYNGPGCTGQALGDLHDPTDPGSTRSVGRLLLDQRLKQWFVVSDESVVLQPGSTLSGYDFVDGEWKCWSWIIPANEPVGRRAGQKLVARAPEQHVPGPLSLR